MKRYAYLTYLGTDDYLPGTLALIEELKHVKSKYPIYVLVANDLGKETICQIETKAKVIKSQKFKIPNEVLKHNNQTGYSRWNRTFEKLQVFGLEQFDKIVMLDSDMLIKSNIDELFEKPNLSAVAAGQAYPGNENWEGLNSGTMVITPSKLEFTRLTKLIGVNTWGDQAVIQKAYPDWNKDVELHLSDIYNMISGFEAYYVGVKKLKNIKIVHFTHKIKPWKMNKIYRFKYICSLLIRQIVKCNTILGIKSSLNGFLTYCKICNQCNSKTK